MRKTKAEPIGLEETKMLNYKVIPATQQAPQSSS
jgi:hypothetical protein